MGRVRRTLAGCDDKLLDVVSIGTHCESQSNSCLTMNRVVGLLCRDIVNRLIFGKGLAGSGSLRIFKEENKEYTAERSHKLTLRSIKLSEKNSKKTFLVKKAF